jgi:hypothetical protein
MGFAAPIVAKVGAMSTAAKVGAGLGIAQAGLSFAGQKASAKAQAAAQARSSKAEIARYRQQTSAARIQQRFEMEQEAQELQNASIKALQARSRARVAAGEAGVKGNSVDALLNDFSRQESKYRFGLMRQGQQRDVARNLAMRDMNQQSYNNLLTINKPIEQPNFGEALLSGVSTGLSVYSGIKTE